VVVTDVASDAEEPESLTVKVADPLMFVAVRDGATTANVPVRDAAASAGPAVATTKATPNTAAALLGDRQLLNMAQQ